MLSISSRLGCNSAPPQLLFNLNSRSHVHDFGHCFELIKLPRNDPSLECIARKVFLILELKEWVSVRYFLISLNACWQALSQMNETLLFISLVKGWQHPERFNINHWI